MGCIYSSEHLFRLETTPTTFEYSEDHFLLLDKLSKCLHHLYLLHLNKHQKLSRSIQSGFP